MVSGRSPFKRNSPVQHFRSFKKIWFLYAHCRGITMVFDITCLMKGEAASENNSPASKRRLLRNFHEEMRGSKIAYLKFCQSPVPGPSKGTAANLACCDEP